jgi:CRP-like cAMP-binding protein
MAHTASAKYFRTNEYLFHENDQARSLFLVKSGTIAIRKRRGTGFVELARIYSNEVIGELSFFDREPRSASAIALSEVEVLEIPFEALDKIFESVPSYMRTIVTAMAERLRKSGDLLRRTETRADGEPVVKSDGELSAVDVIGLADKIDESRDPEED